MDIARESDRRSFGEVLAADRREADSNRRRGPAILTESPPKWKAKNMPDRDVLLKYALAAFGAVFLLVYPLAIIWPSDWTWHHGAPYESQYFMMIVGIYATLGVFLLFAARDPKSNLSLIWFTI